MAVGDQELKAQWIAEHGLTICPRTPIDIRLKGMAGYAAKGFSDAPGWCGVANTPKRAKKAARMRAQRKVI